MNILEGWLRHWNREEDAQALRGEIEDFVEHDVIDESFDGIQGLPAIRQRSIAVDLCRQLRVAPKR
jgi:hypothetical protein